jgi:hypothetical protein
VWKKLKTIVQQTLMPHQIDKRCRKTSMWLKFGVAPGDFPAIIDGVVREKLASLTFTATVD